MKQVVNIQFVNDRITLTYITGRSQNTRVTAGDGRFSIAYFRCDVGAHARETELVFAIRQSIYRTFVFDVDSRYNGRNDVGRWRFVVIVVDGGGTNGGNDFFLHSTNRTK